MKKRVLNLIFLFVFIFTFAGHAQTVLYSDNFDTYTLGAYLSVVAPQFVPWNGVAGGVNDITISDEESFSAPHSLKFASVNPDGDGDVVLKLDDKVNGIYEIEFKIQIGEGATEGGYFNMLHVLPPNAEWAFSLIFLPDSTLGFSWNGAGTILGSYTKGTWMDIKVKVNLDVDSAHMFLNNTLLTGWQWSIKEDGGQGLVQLAGLDFYTYAGGGAGSSVLFYVDDVKFTEIIPSGIEKLPKSASVEVWPNPVIDILNVNVCESTIMELYSLAGVCAGTFIIENNKTDLSSIASGVYLARVFSGNSIFHAKVVKK